jgi:chromosome segregation ATPase
MAATPQYETGLTFEKVWALFQETVRKMQETDRQMKETDRQMKETKQIVEETSRQIEETGRQMKETDRQMKETDKRVGFLSNRFGEVVEYMIVPNLVTKFNELGYTFTKANRDTEIKDREHGIFTEVDVFMENGDSVMIVETKAKPDTRDIDDHIKRMEKLRAYADLHKDTRKYYGAMAGVVMSDNVKTYTLNKGFYVIEPSGETFTITAPSGPGVPRVW